METERNRSRWPLLAAAVVLVATAALHATGYRPLVAQLAASAIQPAWLAGVKGLWLVFSCHLVLLATALIVVALRPAGAAPLLLVVLALIPAVDTLTLLWFVGIFPGTVALALVTVLMLAGAVLHRSRRARGEPAC